MSSSSKSSTSTRSDVFNQQVGASEGATAIGAGANVNIVNTDAQVATAAIEGVAKTASDTNESLRSVAETSINQQRAGAADALDFGENISARSYDLLSKQLDQSQKAQQETLNFARQAQELTASQAGVVAPTTFESQQKTLLIGITIVAVVFLFVAMNKKGTA